MPFFWDRHRARFPKKNSKAQKHIQMAQRCALDFFFPQNALGDGPAFWIFFSRIHGYGLTNPLFLPSGTTTHKRTKTLHFSMIKRLLYLQLGKLFSNTGNLGQNQIITI